MISVLLEIERKNGEGLGEGVSAQIRQAFQVLSLAVNSRKEIDEAWTIVSVRANTWLTY
jgi:hypothetical protein